MIGGRSFPLKVEAHKEESVLKVVKELNAKINKFQLDYTKASKEDILSMVLLTYAVDFEEATSGKSDLSIHNDALSEVDEILEAAI